MWVQDGDPSQNSLLARKAMSQCNCESTLIHIPPRSPDTNPIENIFHLVKKRLRKQALQEKVTKESYVEFQERVVNTFRALPVETVNKTIASIDKRLEMIKEKKGNRIKYGNIYK